MERMVNVRHFAAQSVPFDKLVLRYLFSVATRNQVFRWLNNLWANRRVSVLISNLVKRAQKPGFYRDAKHVRPEFIEGLRTSVSQSAV